MLIRNSQTLSKTILCKTIAKFWPKSGTNHEVREDQKIQS